MPTVGDRSSAAERAADPRGWSFSAVERELLSQVIRARRDIRRFRPDLVPEDILSALLEAAHAAPSVGHSQPWRFVVVTEASARAQAALMADRARLAQAALMDPESGRHLLDLDLEGIREAPVGVVVCCDRRVAAEGVLGRATFKDADMWSCACAIQNLWLTARSFGLGVGWVTLFEPGELADLVGAPAGVETLGWLCVGWPDERPPEPGLERRGWSQRQPLESVVIRERWPELPRCSEAAAPPEAPAAPVSRAASAVPDAPAAPVSLAAPTAPVSGAARVVMPSQSEVVTAHDSADALLASPGALGVLDRVVDKVIALGCARSLLSRGTLVIAAADHPVAHLGVSAFGSEVTREVVEASVAGDSVGAVAAAAGGLSVVVVDAGVDGDPVDGAALCRPVEQRGDLVHQDALSAADVRVLLDAGAALGRRLAAPTPAAPGDEAGSAAGLVVVGEVGIGNTTVAAALAAGLLGLDAGAVVGLGAGSDSEIVARKREVVAAALARVGSPADRSAPPAGASVAAHEWLRRLGGPEIAFLTGVVEGAAEAGGVVVLDGLATSVAALVAVTAQPAVAAHLVAGQRSRELAHAPVLAAMGLEPLLDLRLRAGEGTGAAFATGVLRAALRVRLEAARTV